MAKFGSEFFMLVLRILYHQKCVTNPPPQISLREMFADASPESSTTSFRDRGVGERQGGCGIHRAGREWELLQDQSQEPQSRAHGSCIGSVGMLSEHPWVAWSALDGHHFEVPIACRPSDVMHTSSDAFMHVFYRERIGDTKNQKNEMFSPQSSAACE